jgi:hypothetical protein
LSLEWSREKEEVLTDLERAQKTGDVERENSLLRRIQDRARERHGS